MSSQFEAFSPNVAKAVPSDQLRQMANSGDMEFKNAFQAGGGNSARNESGYQSGRIGTESQMGYSSDTPAVERPKYGFVPLRRPGRLTRDTALPQYGDATVLFKKNINNRVTTTMGDSNQMGASPLQITPLTKSGRSLGLPSTAGLADKNPVYKEAQVHGSLSLRDAKKILHPDKKVAKELQGKLREQGIRVKVGKARSGPTKVETAIDKVKGKASDISRQFKDKKAAAKTARYWNSPEGKARAAAQESGSTNPRSGV
jgi:hypothetical protein